MGDADAIPLSSFDADVNGHLYSCLLSVKYNPERIGAREVLRRMHRHAQQVGAAQLFHDQEMTARILALGSVEQREEEEALELRRCFLRSLPLCLIILVLVFVVPFPERFQLVLPFGLVPREDTAWLGFGLPGQTTLHTASESLNSALVAPVYFVPGLHYKTLLFFLCATPVQFVYGKRFHVNARRALK